MIGPRALLLVVVVLIGHASTVAAQSIRMGTFRGYLTGHLGMAVGGEISDARLTPGVSVAVHEQDGWGAELDFGRATDAPSGGRELDVTTYMVNGSWVKPTGAIRPFGLIGAGIMQIHGCDATCSRTATTYDFGLSTGAGVFALVNDSVGFRGDVRYLFSGADHPDLGRPEKFGFWRISIGATFSWTILP
jgi:hypothetical protein